MNWDSNWSLSPAAFSGFLDKWEDYSPIPSENNITLFWGTCLKIKIHPYSKDIVSERNRTVILKNPRTVPDSFGAQQEFRAYEQTFVYAQFPVASEWFLNNKLSLLY